VDNLVVDTHNHSTADDLVTYLALSWYTYYFSRNLHCSVFPAVFRVSCKIGKILDTTFWLKPIELLLIIHSLNVLTYLNTFSIGTPVFLHRQIVSQTTFVVSQSNIVTKLQYFFPHKTGLVHIDNDDVIRW